MAMTDAQREAFSISAGGFAPSISSNLFLGVVITAALLWGVWTLITAYRGWANGNVSFGAFGGVFAKVMILIVILMWFTLS